jgi:cation diffusion facilitator family transporter
VWASAGFAIFSSLWGIVSGSSMIVFDGMYSFVSIGLSGLAVLALRFVRRGPDERFPWGREAAEPLVVILKAATLGALCVYAGVGGVIDILEGGRDVEVGWAIVYAVIATAASLAVGLVLRRGTRSDSSAGPGKDLVRSEAAEWLGDALLSAGVLVGFLFALLLTSRGRPDLAAYVDPAMVVVVSAAFLVVPLRLVIGGMREVLSMSPPEAIQLQLRAVVDEVRRRHRLQEGIVRAAKVGGRMDIEVDYVVGSESSVITVADCDAVRSELHERLSALGYEKSVVVALTNDRRWAQ